MSYILDALKKMEHEKAKKKGAAGMGSISGELFRPEKFKQNKGRTWIIAASVVLVAVLASAVTWYLLKDDNNAKTAKTVSTEPTTPAGRGTSATPPPVPVASLPQPVPVPVTAPAAPTAPAVPAASAPAVVKSPAAVPRSRSEEDGEEGRRGARRGAAPEQPAAQSMAPPADIKVSGIAWQEERSARRAVVNGFLLKEGAVVGGAKITEILQEKVKFSMSGRTFEISMQSSGVTGAGKCVL
jgi:general secretion pathway protein B